jgi:hypothetical protein
MERLTKRENGHAHYPRCFEKPCGGMGCRTEDCEFNVEICERLAAYEDTGLTPGEVKSMQEEHFSGLEMAKLHSALMELKKYQEADKDGRLVVLPCKVGDTLFRVFAGEILEHKVSNMRYLAIQGRWDIDTIPFCSYVESSIGKTIFLTREEAEKALEAMKDE